MSLLRRRRWIFFVALTLFDSTWGSSCWEFCVNFNVVNYRFVCLLSTLLVVFPWPITADACYFWCFLVLCSRIFGNRAFRWCFFDRSRIGGQNELLVYLHGWSLLLISWAENIEKICLLVLAVYQQSIVASPEPPFWLLCIRWSFVGKPLLSSQSNQLGSYKRIQQNFDFSPLSIWCHV